MKNAKDDAPRQAVMFELENVAANGHAVLYGILKEILGKKNVDLAPATFARYCMNSTVDKFLGRILSDAGKPQLSADSIGEEIKKAYVDALVGTGVKLSTGLRSIIEGAAKKGIPSGALSCLGPDAAQRVLTHLALDSMGVTLRPRNAEFGSCVNKDEWIKLADSMSAVTRASVAITSTAESCRSALSAGMKVMVCPGKYAGFADFSGADGVVDVLDKASAELALSLLEPCQWS